MKKWLLFGLAIIVLVGFSGVTGCESTPEEENSFLEMLKLVPDTPGTRNSVYINGYARIREIYDIPLLSLDADDEAIADYMAMLVGLAGDLSAMPVDLSFGRRLGEVSFVSGMGPGMWALLSPIRRQNIGFGPQDVDVGILAGVPPVRLEAIKGRYDTSAIEQAVNSYESEMPRFEEYEGMTVIDWGYGGNEIMLAKRLEPPAFDHLGRCRPLGVGDQYIFRAYTTDLIKVMIDVSQGREGLIEGEGFGLRLTSLADNAEFSLMAEALSEMGAYSAFLTDQVLDLGNSLDILLAQLEEPVTRKEIIAEVGQLLSPYRTLATGIGKDEEGALMTIVLVYNSPEEASSDVPVFEQRLEEGTSVWTGEPWRDRIDSWEVWADGRTLRARLRGQIIRSWLEIVYQREILFLQGE